MSLLLAMTGWHVEDWRARFQALLPDMPIVVLGEPFDRRAVHYVASWKHPPGSLTGLPNLAAIFSLGCFYVLGSLEQLHGATPSERTFLGVIPMLGSFNVTVQILRIITLKRRLPRQVDA